MFQFEVLQQPLPVRTEGKQKQHQKTSRRILEVAAKICGTQWEDKKKDLINAN
jgi:hypothetical protein